MISTVGLKTIKITDISGIQIGHASDFIGGTGCTVIMCKNGACAGIAVRGGAPATRETDLLAPQNMVQKIHAVVLSGGSAYGLACSTGVMDYLEERNIGYDVGVGVVPIVCSACLFDLGVGDSKARPDQAMGYQACLNADNGIDSDKNGNIGAGTGATVGKICGLDRMMKSGLGNFAGCCGELQVAAIVAVNALGDVYDQESGKIIAGLLSEDKKTLADSAKELYKLSPQKIDNPFTANTTIGCIITNAKLTKAEATKVASVAHDGLARTIFPVHTQADGDALFTLATGEITAPLDLVSSIASQVAAQAIKNAVLQAKSVYGLPAASDFIDSF